MRSTEIDAGKHENYVSQRRPHGNLTSHQHQQPSNNAILSPAKKTAILSPQQKSPAVLLLLE